LRGVDGWATFGDGMGGYERDRIKGSWETPSIQAHRLHHLAPYRAGVWHSSLVQCSSEDDVPLMPASKWKGHVDRGVRLLHTGVADEQYRPTKSSSLLYQDGLIRVPALWLLVPA